MFQTQNFSIGAVATWQSKLIRFQQAVPQRQFRFMSHFPSRAPMLAVSLSCLENRANLWVSSPSLRSLFRTCAKLVKKAALELMTKGWVGAFQGQMRDVAWVLKMHCIDCNVQHPFHETQIVVYWYWQGYKMNWKHLKTSACSLNPHSIDAILMLHCMLQVNTSSRCRQENQSQFQHGEPKSGSEGSENWWFGFADMQINIYIYLQYLIIYNIYIIQYIVYIYTCTYIYTYIYVYTCICTYIYIHVYIYIYTCVYIYTYIYVYTYICTCIYIYTCVYRCHNSCL